MNVEVAGKNFHISLDPRRLNDGKEKSFMDRLRSALEWDKPSRSTKKLEPDKEGN